MNTKEKKKFDLKSWLSGYFTPAVVILGLVSMWVIADTRTFETAEDKIRTKDHVNGAPNDVDVFKQGEELIKVTSELKKARIASDSVFSFAKEIVQQTTENQQDAIASRAKRDSLVNLALESIKINSEENKKIRTEVMLNKNTSQLILKKLDSLNGN